MQHTQSIALDLLAWNHQQADRKGETVKGNCDPRPSYHPNCERGRLCAFIITIITHNATLQGGTQKLWEFSRNDATTLSCTPFTYLMMFSEDVCRSRFCEFFKWMIQENKETASSFVSSLVKQLLKHNTWSTAFRDDLYQKHKHSNGFQGSKTNFHERQRMLWMAIHKQNGWKCSKDLRVVYQDRCLTILNLYKKN